MEGLSSLAVYTRIYMAILQIFCLLKLMAKATNYGIEYLEKKG